ncbi:unnamed protein product [Adineta steineri]|uniref:G-protein coupled receptors family 1 profile domain-containing protein n=2 Tax=Adineta steineri TaxID=433720 RepID=A0A813SZ73_9BILA|nr:unnamed protein product [Adineta steineri]CAF1239128.1 unnamed protein product [Adineta steineri]CAF1441870.1 unnamed protein product [Adineta steineri]CAF1627966.1 unnamed protein product [Adineta steineri]
MSSLNLTDEDFVIDSDVLSSIRKSQSLARNPFDHYVNGVCGLIICLLGIVSNALSFSILIRRVMRLSTYVYLAGLCLSDFTTCLFLLPGYILNAYPLEIPDYDLPRTYAYTKLLIIAGAISTTGRVLSVWLCVAFTIDRWIMICRPFVGPIYCTMKNARCVTLIIFIIGIFYAFPLVLEYEPHEETALNEILFANTNKKNYRYILSKLGKNSIFRWTYVLINALGVYVIPLTIIIILNRKLLISIRLLEQRSAEYRAPSPTKQGVTVMLLATTILLLVFRLPSATISIMWLISAKMFINEKPPFLLRKFHSIANLCATLNAATTFIMFIIYGAKFRSEFTNIYCCCLNRLKRKQVLFNNQHEQNIKEILSSDINVNEQSITNQINPFPINQSYGKVRQVDTRHSSSATTTTSISSLPSLRRLRYQRRSPRYSIEREYDFMNHNNPNRNLQQHYELTT